MLVACACQTRSGPPSDDATIVIAEPESVEGAEPTARGLQFEGLLQLRADGRGDPVLAESWRWEQAGLRLRITLRPNVRTHKGVLVTPAMAADALSQAMHEPRNLARYWTLANVRAVHAADGDVVIDLKEPTGALPEDLDLQLSFDGAGTGPFREVSSGANEIVMARFDQYHRGRPAIGRVIVRSGMTRRPAWTSLLRGDVDMVTNVPSDTLQFLGSEQIELRSFLRRYQYLVAFNLQRQPFANAEVMRAMNLAIDRPLIVDKLLAGRGVEATGPLFPSHWSYDRTHAGFRYDPVMAAALLDAGGWPLRTLPNSTRQVRFSFTCLLPEGVVVAERVGLEVQRQLYRIGIDMQFETMPLPAYVKRVFSSDFEAAFLDLASGPSFGRVFAFWASRRQLAGLNVFGYENQEAARLFETLRATTDEAEIRSAARRLQRVFLDDPPALFIAWSERTRAVSRRFEIRGPAERDPLLSLWQWTPRRDAGPRSPN
jgi:ABC-type transport system substrate-binding protein